MIHLIALTLGLVNLAHIRGSNIRLRFRIRLVDSELHILGHRLRSIQVNHFLLLLKVLKLFL